MFKYNATDYENIIKDQQNQINESEESVDENKNENPNNSESNIKEYQQCRFEWIYITVNDNISYHKLNDSNSNSYLTALLPEQYSKITQYLSKNDPIPPHFLRRASYVSQFCAHQKYTNLGYLI